jgi:Ca2+/H+ antiporter, TMEM165/GDT1 family
MLTAFTASLLLITVSELGDKTFCIAMLLAMRHPRRFVLVGVVAALNAMTLISVLMGHVVSFLPKHYLQIAEVVLFIAFGLKLLYDAYHMPIASSCEDMAEVEQTLADSKGKFGGQLSVIVQSFILTFAAEWGDRTQFATITLAASNNLVGVIMGGVLGHTLCAVIAILSGRMIAKWLSERILTAIGGGLFVMFGVLAAVERS